MNVIQQARQAYAPANSPLRTGRSAELQAFSDATAGMRRASGNGPFDMPAIAAALHSNRRLWTLLAAEVADADNALPRALRAQIFYLAEFTMQHSAKVLRGEASIEPLIDINVAVMRGLAGPSASGGTA